MASSTSLGATLKPPVMMSSLMRSTIAHEAVVVDRDDVARAEPVGPAVVGGHEHRLGLLGLLPVAREHLRAAHDELALGAGLAVDASGSSGSTTRTSVEGSGSPTVPALRFGATGLAMSTGEHSERP